MGFMVFAAMYQALALAKTVSPIVIGTQLSIPFAVLLGWIFLKEKVSPLVMLAIFIAFSGIVIIAFDETLLASWGALFWATIMALSYGASTVISRNIRSLDSKILTGWMAIISLPVIATVSYIFESDHWHYIETASLSTWLVTLHAGIVVNVIAHVGLFSLLRRYAVAQVMPFYVLTPIFGVLLSIIMFDETLTLQVAIGSAFVISAIFMINRYGTKSIQRPKDRQ